MLRDWGSAQAKARPLRAKNSVVGCIVECDFEACVSGLNDAMKFDTGGETGLIYTHDLAEECYGLHITVSLRHQGILNCGWPHTENPPVTSIVRLSV